MKLMDALRQEDRLTENGMATNSTSLSAVVDLFYNIGAMRGQDKGRLLSDFSKAFYQVGECCLRLQHPLEGISEEDAVSRGPLISWARKQAGYGQLIRDFLSRFVQYG